MDSQIRSQLLQESRQGFRRPFQNPNAEREVGEIGMGHFRKSGSEVLSFSRDMTQLQETQGRQHASQRVQVGD